MAKTIKYFCDLCKNEMEKAHCPNEIRIAGRTSIDGTANRDLHIKDVCNPCLVQFWVLIESIESEKGVGGISLNTLEMLKKLIVMVENPDKKPLID